MKTKKLSLKAYSALSIALLAQTQAEAQVVITDFEPDLRMMNWREDGLTNDTITIDVDENGIYDLMFVYEIGGSLYIEASVYAYFNDAVEAFFTNDSWWSGAHDFHYGDTIHYSSSYLSESALLFISTFYDGWYDTWDTNWGNFHTDEYLGFVLNIDGAQHYGWVRLSCKTMFDEDNSALDETGSPLTIYELAYEQTPLESIVCQGNSLPELSSISSVTLKDDIDANDVTDLLVSFHVDTLPDFSELRFFLVSSKDDILHFSVDDALSLPPDRYFKIPADSLVVDTYYTSRLPLGLNDINGNPFTSEKYYSGFYMKIPMEGDLRRESLSAPYDVVKPELQQCHLEIEDIDLYFNDEGFFEVSFYSELYDPDVDSFGIALAEYWVLTWTAWDNYYEDFEWDEIDFSSVINITKTMDTFYVKSLEGITTDVYGNSIDSGEIFNPIILGYADGYYRDLMCLSTKKIYLHYPPEVESSASTPGLQMKHNINIIQSQPGYFDIFIEEYNVSGYTLEMKNINGQVLYFQTISSPHQTFSFPSLPDGIYIATVKENDVPVAVAKVILQH